MIEVGKDITLDSSSSRKGMLQRRGSGVRLSPGGLLIVFVGVLLCIAFLWKVKPSALRSSGSSPLYDNKLDREHVWYRRECLNVKQQPNFYDFEQLLTAWRTAASSKCGELLRLFDQVYTFESRRGSVKLPDAFAKKVRGWLDNNEELFGETKSQLVFSIFNKYTHESTLFSKLRSKRPGLLGSDDPRKFAEKLGKDTEGSCDFCRYR